MSLQPIRASLSGQSMASADTGRMIEIVRAVYTEGRRDLDRHAAPADVATARDKVAAMEDVIRRAVRERDERLYAQNLLAELRLYQERWLGGWLAAHVNHSGGGDRRSRKRSETSGRDLPAGITKNQSSTFQRLAAIPEGVFTQYLQDSRDGRKEITTAGALRYAEQSATTAPRVRVSPRTTPGRHPRQPATARPFAQNIPHLVDGGIRFGTIYVAPPWPGSNGKTMDTSDRPAGSPSTSSLPCRLMNSQRLILISTCGSRTRFSSSSRSFLPPGGSRTEAYSCA